MKRRSEIADREKYVADKQEVKEKFQDHTDFYRRWYAKFGKPEDRTMPADQFLARLKEMIDFE